MLLLTDRRRYSSKRLLGFNPRAHLCGPLAGAAVRPAAMEGYERRTAQRDSRHLHPVDTAA